MSNLQLIGTAAGSWFDDMLRCWHVNVWRCHQTLAVCQQLENPNSSDSFHMLKLPCWAAVVLHGSAFYSLFTCQAAKTSVKMEHLAAEMVCYVQTDQTALKWWTHKSPPAQIKSPVSLNCGSSCRITTVTVAALLCCSWSQCSPFTEGGESNLLLFICL